MSTEFINDQWRLPNEENKSKVSNYSMDFDTSSKHIGLGEDLFSTLTSNFSISFWANPSGAAANKDFMAFTFGSSNIFYNTFFLNFNDESITFKINNTSLWQLQFPTDADLANFTSGWNHYLIVYTPGATSTCKVYINNSSTSFSNGTLISNFSTAPTPNTTSGNPLKIGNPSPYSSGCKLDAVAIFNYALSSSQITTLYGSSSTGIGNPMSLSPKPVSYYPLGDQDAFNGANYLVPNSSLKDYVFDFSGSLINFSSSINLGTVHTISYWGQVDYNASALSHSQSNISSGYIIQHSNYSNGTYGFRPQSTAGTTWGLSNQSVEDAITKSKNGEWVQFTLVRNGNDVSLYADGDFLQSVTVAWGAVDTIFSSLGGLGVCKYSNFLFWNTNLSSTEVATLYNNGSPIQTLSSIPQSSNVQGWYKLNASATYDSSTTTWTIPDDSTNSNTGTSSGMTQANLVQSDLSFTSGYSPYALDFDRPSGQYTSVGTVNLSNSWSVSIWAAWTDTTGSRVALNGSNGLLQYTPQTSPSGGLMMYPDDTTNNYFDVTPAINDGNWHNIVFSYDNSTTTLKTYTDGYLSDSRVNTAGATNIQFVGGNVVGWYWNGKLSNCSVWNTNLSATQVTEIYNEGVPSNLNNHSAYSNLTNWWQLGSNSSFNTNWTVLDEKGSNNGTSANMTEDDIVDGVGSYANGLSSGMGGDEVIGDAPYSTANSLSVNMDVLDRVTDTPS